MDVPLPILEREVAKAAAESARAKEALSRGEPIPASPLARLRRASSRETWLELGESKDPLAAALRPWVAELTLDRVLWADEARLAAAWHAPTIHVEEPGVTAFAGSPRDLLRRVLADAEPRRRRVYADALARGASAAADAALILAERRKEAVRLLGADMDAIEIPIPERASMIAIAERVLADTTSFAGGTRESWSDAIAFAIGRSASDGWPARLGPRWLFDLFHEGPLTEGLRLDLPPLPAALGAASFARALAAFGAALAEEDGPRGAPLGLVRSPFDLRRARRAALFGSLAADPIFGWRALGLGRDRARDQARAIARSLLVSLRLDAARVILRGAMVLPDRAARFEERTFDAIGAPIPPALGGLVPRVGPGDPTRLAGALIALRDRRDLVDRFDEDWWKSPHATRAIREEDAAVPSSLVAPAAALEAGLAELVRALSDLG